MHWGHTGRHVTQRYSTYHPFQEVRDDTDTQPEVEPDETYVESQYISINDVDTVTGMNAVQINVVPKTGEV